MQRPLTALGITVFVFCVLACGGTQAPPRGSAEKGDRPASEKGQPGDAGTPGQSAARPETDRAEAKRWAEKWSAEQEAKAVQLSQKIEELETRIAEREATYKRRTEAGASDGATKREIEQLKKELDDTLNSLAELDEVIAAGPPPYTPESPAGPATAKPAPQSRPVVTAPGSGPKVVQVRGYTRKDGTVVAPHTRSAPRR
ncbi:MAG TPA: hypothetical protein VKE74_19510 [Gemmataceae bacterium]|nr:hypothetical protein [Gemmataceae bacterium]